MDESLDTSDSEEHLLGSDSNTENFVDDYVLTHTLVDDDEKIAGGVSDRFQVGIYTTLWATYFFIGRFGPKSSAKDTHSFFLFLTVFQ
jgi:hypothetical protein